MADDDREDIHYRVVAYTPGQNVQSREFIRHSKALAQAERWARVPTFESVAIVPSLPVEWDYTKIESVKGETFA